MSQTITLTAPDQSTFEAYVAEPAGDPVGGLVLIHEIWGLVAHIRDVADRYAAEGFVVVAPDILSRGGVSPEIGEELFAVRNDPDEEARVAAQPRLRELFSAAFSPELADWAVPALGSAVDWLEDRPGVRGRIAVSGFCFGGSYAFLLAARDDRVRAAVPFYGAPPPPADIARIHVPVLAFYGQDDPRLIDALPALKDDMTRAGVDFEAVVYPDAGHAFFNDTGPAYRAAESRDAWRRTLEFLRARVGR